MRDEVVVKRYADAFLNYCKENIGFEKGLEELHEAKHVLRDNTDFRDFLEAPDIANGEKYALIDKVLNNYFSEGMRNFLKILVEKRRIGLFDDIAEYARVTYAHSGIKIDAILKTSYPIDTPLLKSMHDALEKRVGRKLDIHLELDPDLLGGAYAKIGNIVIDGSVRRRLEDLKEKLTILKVI